MINAVQQTIEVVDRASAFGVDLPLSYQARMARVIASRNGELPADDPDYERLKSITTEVNTRKPGLKDK